jgi:hypothetical protein
MHMMFVEYPNFGGFWILTIYGRMFTLIFLINVSFIHHLSHDGEVSDCPLCCARC